MYQGDKGAGAGSDDPRTVFWSSMISGAAAGVVCDVVFFPMDTVKTRLQSQHGFQKSGGFKNLYKGLGPVVAGSAPIASLFFVTYEGFKVMVRPMVDVKYHSFVHMGAAASAEIVSCLVKVPVEVLKQRRQALLANAHPVALGIRTLYRGYGSTLLRDLPFGFLQMPLWEYLKLCWKRKKGRECTPFEGATAGALSVTVSAAVTTPLDVIKTRIMLAHQSQKKVKILSTMREVYREKGIRGLFTGCTLRAVGFTVGGFVFFGIYEQSRYLCATLIFPETSVIN
ncbi:S-adenosylmethionine mitochondrial carrier protein homolog [Diachasmimorpha longicaudata]|uniref:S-adenosylmethionine mitochondrial carrier protein homolog n=1 Tax=Diachasmimorpha longicaudata TaxID=58733 RepID=UPI0030B8EA25